VVGKGGGGYGSVVEVGGGCGGYVGCLGLV
jgi:hypothetical protein